MPRQFVGLAVGGSAIRTNLRRIGPRGAITVTRRCGTASEIAAGLSSNGETMLLFLQDAVNPTWVGPTMAIALVVIAMAFVLIAVALALTARQAAHEMQQLSRVIESLRTDLAPALTAVQAVSNEGQRLAALIGGETEELVDASRRLREGVRERVANLEAIYEVVAEEVEETALDIAVTLRRIRTGAGWFRRIRRLLGGGRRR